MSDLTNNIISLNDVTKKFGHTVALDALNLNVKKGEIHGFLGPNGAGKSTTIRVMLGLLQVNSGEVKLFDKDPWKDAVEIHRDIAYIPGDVNLWPNLTGGEIIDILSNLKKSPNKKRRNELVDLFDLDTSKKFHTYSKGNRQKVAIISALASDAKLYLMDEPTSGLDPLLERHFQEYILHEVKSEDKTILLSSHILSEVDKLCDTVTIIKEGKAVLSDSLKSLRHMTHTTIKVEFENDIDLEKLKNMASNGQVEKTENEFEFKVEAEKLNYTLQFITQHKVKTLHSTPPTLEELFMSHYSNE